MNILLDVNIIFDNFDHIRRKKFKESVIVFDFLVNNKEQDILISTSSLDNLKYLKLKDLKMEYPSLRRQQLIFMANEFVEYILSVCKLAKTPSYMKVDYEDIEDSQVIASAKAVNAKVITRDAGMLNKYADIAITPLDFLRAKSQEPKTTIDFANLKKQYFMYQPEIEEAMDNVLNNASYIMGGAIRELEENLQEYTGAKHAITCGSGTDALLLAMLALDIGPGDEVITTPFTFIATAETIALLRAKPVFVDIDEETYNIDPAKIEAAITDKTRAIIPVSLYGQPADMDAIQKIVDKTLKTKNQKLTTIIDGAQSFGSTYKGKTDSNLGDISSTSFFPAKPLGCFGDGGALFTNDDTLADKIKSLRVHGQSKRYHHQYIGMGGRMDTLQAAILNTKLKHYPKDLALRQEVAEKYSDTLSNMFQLSSASDSRLPTSDLVLQTVLPDRTSAWAQYSVRLKRERRRGKIQQELKESGIPTAIHYPMSLHLQECFQYLGYKKGDFPICEKISDEIISLPMNPYLSEKEIEYICKVLNEAL